MVEETINSSLMCNVYRQQVVALQAEKEKLRKEISQLRELICKAKGIIQSYRFGYQDTYPHDDMKKCVAQMDQVLEEKNNG